MKLRLCSDGRRLGRYAADIQEAVLETLNAKNYRRCFTITIREFFIPPKPPEQDGHRATANVVGHRTWKVGELRSETEDFERLRP